MPDDQPGLAPAVVGNRADRLNAGLERLLHALAIDDTRRLELERAVLIRLDRPAAVERIAERVDDSAEERLADRHRSDAAGTADRLPLLHMLPLAEERCSDIVLLEIE